MSDEDLLKEYEKGKGKPKVVANNGKWTSWETQGRLVGARGNKLGKEMKRRRFTALLVNL